MDGNLSPVCKALYLTSRNRGPQRIKLGCPSPLLLPSQRHRLLILQPKHTHHHGEILGSRCDYLRTCDLCIGRPYRPLHWSRHLVFSRRGSMRRIVKGHRSRRWSISAILQFLAVSDQFFLVVGYHSPFYSSCLTFKNCLLASSPLISDC